MEKEFVISSLIGLIEARKYWDELSNHIDSLGGDFYETKYVEAYHFHEELVYNLIKECRGFSEIDEEEFEIFQSALFYLSKNEEFKLSDENFNLVKSIKNGKELYDFMESEIVNYIKK